MVQVFQPLEVGDGDTASVDVHVRDDQGTVLLQDLVGSRGDWSVGGLADDLGLHLVCIAFVDHLLHGSRILSAAGVIGPLAASPMILAFTLCALPLWITFSMAAGTRMSACSNITFSPV